jgi:hypothetical protein
VLRFAEHAISPYGAGQTGSRRVEARRPGPFDNGVVAVGRRGLSRRATCAAPANPERLKKYNRREPQVHVEYLE